MRRVMSGGLVVAFAAALVSGSALAAPPLKPASQAGRTDLSATRAGGENNKARLDEIAREKRWSERMRRATNSMCDRC